MTLRLKINAIVSLLTLLFVATMLALELRTMHASVQEEVIAANRVAVQLLNRTARLYATQGTPAMLLFLQGVGRVRSTDITLLDAQERLLYRSPPSAYKAGRDAPRWFAHLAAPPPMQLSIDFPDGKLIVRSNASRALLDVWDDSVLLTASALGLLLIVNAGVFWLVGRATRPFADIVAALDQLQSGRFDVTLRPLPGTEAAAIGTAFNRMVGMLRQHIETERRAVRAESRLSESRALGRWVDQRIEQERRLIARELHDELGQSVTAIRSMALSIAQRVQALDAQAGQAARLIATESARLYTAMHGMIPRLTPLVLDRFGLVAALEDLLERTRSSHEGVEIEAQLDLEPGRVALDADQALVLYRAAQEGITNALRHGQARRIALALRGDGPAIELTLTDDGRGPSGPDASRPAGAGHYGLRWLAERVESLGGALRLEAAMASGARLTVRLPAGAVQEP
ncbi:HAMP domain-containing protein [Verminephrobacter aporrectodeae subsp. tuberculatae]|uniref:HAMP domain-containing protein n=1 Tax=Verminephrobacter aporrectodeae TaxID=1110389 RepID=UPI002243A242|nr:HAMP domain-containing protein [Verminephrobacter aporrectodeae]MCW8165569.1 HAMP domain-containing protein [Verminephrobacter aporrectodeae subsp. tuberculatae]MCW8169580.1 HAMP domain-containing protein [Verminephrobacter aporrectodeae subsp. tuberculatae]